MLLQPRTRDSDSTDAGMEEKRSVTSITQMTLSLLAEYVTYENIIVQYVHCVVYASVQRHSPIK
jgi:hypothetical protein